MRCGSGLRRTGGLDYALLFTVKFSYACRPGQSGDESSDYKNMSLDPYKKGHDPSIRNDGSLHWLCHAN